MSRRRSWIVWSLVVLASLLALVSSFTIWSKRQFLDTNAWVDSSGKLLQNDQIRGALATKLVDVTFQRTDAVNQLEQRLPDNAKGAAPLAAAALQSAATRAADALLATPKAQQLWEDANRKAHETLVAVLEKKNTDHLIVSSGTISLDLRPFVAKLSGRLGLADKVGAATDPQTGDIVLVKSDQLKTAQDAVWLVKKLSVWIAVLVIALYALAIWLARGHRRRWLMRSGASVVFVGMLVLVIRRLVGHYIVDAVVSTEANKPAVNAAWLIETSLLRDIGLALLLYGVAMLVAAFFAGPSRLARRTRQELAPAFRHHLGWVYSVTAMAFLILIAWGPTGATRRLVGVVFLAALVVLGLEAWRRQTLAEFPDPAAPAPVEPPVEEAPQKKAGLIGT